MALLKMTTLMLALLSPQTTAFAFDSALPVALKHIPPPLHMVLRRRVSSVSLKLSDSSKEGESRFTRSSSELNLDNKLIVEEDIQDEGKAATNTVNERLLAELQDATNKEKFGSKKGKALSLVDGFGRPRKTDEEVRIAIEAARDLNGVNPIVTLLGSFFALGSAAVLWYATQQLGIFFLSHPVETDVYFVIRSTQVVRNIAMGLISLASGFFGVTGLGIFLLGVRVAFGVLTGELDPTPIKQNKAADLKMPNVWDLMMGKKPGRRGGGSNDDNNPFGV
jgi:hypothetical protein